MAVGTNEPDHRNTRRVHDAPRTTENPRGSAARRPPSTTWTSCDARCPAPATDQSASRVSNTRSGDSPSCGCSARTTSAPLERCATAATCRTSRNGTPRGNCVITVSNSPIPAPMQATHCPAGSTQTKRLSCHPASRSARQFGALGEHHNIHEPAALDCANNAMANDTLNGPVMQLTDPRAKPPCNPTARKADATRGWTGRRRSRLRTARERVVTPALAPRSTSAAIPTTLGPSCGSRRNTPTL